MASTSSGASLKRSWSSESREKLVWGKELYFDSTQVNANADLDSLTPRFAVEAREAIREHLTALFASEPAPLEKPEASSSEAPLPEHLSQASFCADPTPLPVVLSEAQHEDLATENGARHDWIAQEGRQQREVHGSYERTADFRISTTDPDATPMRLKGGGTHLGYHTRLSGRWRQTSHHSGGPGDRLWR